MSIRSGVCSGWGSLPVERRRLAFRSTMARLMPLRLRLSATVVTHALRESIFSPLFVRSQARTRASCTASSAVGRLDVTNVTAATSRAYSVARNSLKSASSISPHLPSKPRTRERGQRLSVTHQEPGQKLTPHAGLSPCPIEGHGDGLGRLPLARRHAWTRPRAPKLGGRGSVRVSDPGPSIGVRRLLR